MITNLIIEDQDQFDSLEELLSLLINLKVSAASAAHTELVDSYPEFIDIEYDDDGSLHGRYYSEYDDEASFDDDFV